jgi:hypothetical protein
MEGDFDLDNFPDPIDFFPFEFQVITNQQEFIEYWEKTTGNRITRFQSFTLPEGQGNITFRKNYQI